MGYTAKTALLVAAPPRSPWRREATTARLRPPQAPSDWVTRRDQPRLASEPIPVEYTCDGDETSPPLAFTGVPVGTAELAVVVRDPDADGFVHWVVAGLPADTAAIVGGPAESEGTADPALPEGAVEADNGFGESGWAGPCPPEGDHTYELTVYALAEPSGLAAGAEAEDGAQAVEGAEALATATLRGTYERG